MKYCLDFRKKSLNLLKEVDEINFHFDITSLTDIFETYPSQRINFILDEIDLKILETIVQIHQEYSNFNFTVRLPYFDAAAADILKNGKVPYFINILISDWDTLIGLLNENVSDVYIVEELGFELDKVSKVAHEKGTQVRVFPNVCQSKWEKTDTLKTFFIRPEDIDIYEPFVDVFEFFGDKERQEIFYKIYKKDKQWFGKLKELIINFNSELDSRFILPKFAERRISCGKKCLKNGKCKICEEIEKLSVTLEKNKILVKNK